MKSDASCRKLCPFKMQERVLLLQEYGFFDIVISNLYGLADWKIMKS